MTIETIELKADAEELFKFMDGLLADLANAADEIKVLLIDFLNNLSELVIAEKIITPESAVTVHIKPTQLFIDLGIAIRSRDLDFIKAEHSNFFSPVNGESHD